MGAVLRRFKAEETALNKLQLNELGAESFKAESVKPYYAGTLPVRVWTQATACTLTPLMTSRRFTAIG
jgi:hypothetical protein